MVGLPPVDTRSPSHSTFCEPMACPPCRSDPAGAIEKRALPAKTKNANRPPHAQDPTAAHIAHPKPCEGCEPIDVSDGAAMGVRLCHFPARLARHRLALAVR